MLYVQLRFLLHTTKVSPTATQLVQKPVIYCVIFAAFNESLFLTVFWYQKCVHVREQRSKMQFFISTWRLTRNLSLLVDCKTKVPSNRECLCIRWPFPRHACFQTNYFLLSSSPSYFFHTSYEDFVLFVAVVPDSRSVSDQGYYEDVSSQWLRLLGPSLW